MMKGIMAEEILMVINISGYMYNMHITVTLKKKWSATRYAKLRLRRQRCSFAVFIYWN